jgi:hypothetical protein
MSTTLGKATEILAREDLSMRKILGDYFFRVQAVIQVTVILVLLEENSFPAQQLFYAGAVIPDLCLGHFRHRECIYNQVKLRTIFEDIVELEVRYEGNSRL